MTDQQMRLVNWRALRQGKLFGFADVELPIGLRIDQCPVLDGPEGVWASLPTRPEIDRDGSSLTHVGSASSSFPAMR
jgi:hypothetical protein